MEMTLLRKGEHNSSVESIGVPLLREGEKYWPIESMVVVKIIKVIFQLNDTLSAKLKGHLAMEGLARLVGLARKNEKKNTSSSHFQPKKS